MMVGGRSGCVSPWFCVYQREHDNKENVTGEQENVTGEHDKWRQPEKVYMRTSTSSRMIDMAPEIT